MTQKGIDMGRCMAHDSLTTANVEKGFTTANIRQQLQNQQTPQSQSVNNTAGPVNVSTTAQASRQK